MSRNYYEHRHLRVLGGVALDDEDVRDPDTSDLIDVPPADAYDRDDEDELGE